MCGGEVCLPSDMSVPVHLEPAPFYVMIHPPRTQKQEVQGRRFFDFPYLKAIPKSAKQMDRGLPVSCSIFFEGILAFYVQRSHYILPPVIYRMYGMHAEAFGSGFTWASSVYRW